MAKRRKEFINQSPNIDNIYAKAIITQFESKGIYKTEYFLVFETITSNVKSFFEKKKLEMTTSINERVRKKALKKINKRMKIAPMKLIQTQALKRQEKQVQKKDNL